MNDLQLWVEILAHDVDNGYYFDALGDVEQVKICLAEALRSAIEQYSEKIAKAQ